MTATARTAAVPETPGTLRAAWRELRAAPDRLLVPTGVLVVAGTVLHVLGQYLISETVATSRHCVRLYLGQGIGVDCGPSNARAQVALVLGTVVLVTVAHLVVAGIYRVALGAGSSWISVVATSGLVAVLMTLSAAFLLVPALVVAFLTRYALLFVLDQGQRPWTAVVSSTRFVATHLRAELGFVLRAGALLLGAALPLGLGLVAAVPVVLVAQTQRYQQGTEQR